MRKRNARRLAEIKMRCGYENCTATPIVKVEYKGTNAGWLCLEHHAWWVENIEASETKPRDREELT